MASDHAWHRSLRNPPLACQRGDVADFGTGMALSAAQIAARQTGLGGSDAGAIVGVNPYSGPFDVWARFHLPSTTGAVPDSEASEWGDLLEDPIRQKYARDRKVEIIRPTLTVRHPDHAFMLANPDGLVVSTPRPTHGPLWHGGLEVKTAGLRVAHRWGDPDTEPDRIPEEYRLQCCHYMAVYDLPWFDLPVLLGGQDYRVYRVWRDAEVEKLLIESEQEFWERYVVTGDEPPVLSSKKLDHWLGVLYPRHRLPEVDASAEAVEIARKYAQARDQASEADETKKFLGNQLRAALKENEGFRWGRKNYVTWKNNRDGSFTDWEAMARALTPADQLDDTIKKFTKPTRGDRVLRVFLKD